MQQYDDDDAAAGGDCDSCVGHLLDVPDEDALDAILPFVNGVLLGYPFVYCVSADTVERACSWLSTTDLLLCGCGMNP
jgi:hypothetical protein